MEIEFKFKIGDLVVHKAHARALALANATKRRDISFGPTDKQIVLIVTDVLSQQCSGGIQKQYNCRRASEVDIGDAVVLHEIELELAPVPPEQERSRPW